MEEGVIMNINEIMKELAQYTRMSEEINATLEGLKDQLKKYMSDNNIDTITGDEHKATYKEVTSNRIDTTALKQQFPEVAKRFTKTTKTKRFSFT